MIKSQRDGSNERVSNENGLRQHCKDDDSRTPAIRWHSHVTQVFVFQCTYTFWGEIRDGTANMEGFFIGSWTSKTKVGNLDARVRTRGVQQNVLGLSRGWE